jgi:protein phosphatase
MGHTQNGLQLEYAALTDMGQNRRNNEDAFGLDPELNFAVVCDGMGGANAGEVASALAVDSLLRFFRSSAWRAAVETASVGDPDFSAHTNVLGAALLLANEQILVHAAADRVRQGMGTTCVATWVPDLPSASEEAQPIMSIGWIGDSRAYLLRESVLRALTRDHSIVMEQVRRGLLTPAEARVSPFRNVLSRAMGTGEDVQPGLAELPLLAGDIVLLCSDGLCGVLTDDQLQAILNQPASNVPPSAPPSEGSPRSAPLDQLCASLIQEANRLGGPDNITALLIRVSGP